MGENGRPFEEALTAISDVLWDASSPISATEVATELDVSRVTVRRYLEHLVKTKQVEKQPRHGTPGRPKYEYRWV